MQENVFAEARQNSSEAMLGPWSPDCMLGCPRIPRQMHGVPGAFKYFLITNKFQGEHSDPGHLSHILQTTGSM